MFKSWICVATFPQSSITILSSVHGQKCIWENRWTYVTITRLVILGTGMFRTRTWTDRWTDGQSMNLKSTLPLFLWLHNLNAAAGMAGKHPQPSLTQEHFMHLCKLFVLVWLCWARCLPMLSQHFPALTQLIKLTPPQTHSFSPSGTF